MLHVHSASRSLRRLVVGRLAHRRSFELSGLLMPSTDISVVLARMLANKVVSAWAQGVTSFLCSAQAPPSPVSISSRLPFPIREWWIWTEVGFDAWREDVWGVVGWMLAALALLLVSPIAGIGWIARLAREKGGVK